MAYVYVNLLLKDPDTMAAYREKAGAALQKHGAKVLVSTPTQTVIEGERDTTGIGVILQFASPEAAKGWINDPELQKVHALRQAAAARARSRFWPNRHSSLTNAPARRLAAKPPPLVGSGAAPLGPGAGRARPHLMRATRFVLVSNAGTGHARAGRQPGATR
ncbi:DUF1330 domain-containing protein [Phaeobacter sp. BS34]